MHKLHILRTDVINYCLKGENWELGEGAGEGRAEDEGEETMREWDGRDGERTRG